MPKVWSKATGSTPYSALVNILGWPSRFITTWCFLCNYYIFIAEISAWGKSQYHDAICNCIVN